MLSSWYPRDSYSFHHYFLEILLVSSLFPWDSVGFWHDLIMLKASLHTPNFREKACSKINYSHISIMWRVGSPPGSRRGKTWSRVFMLDVWMEAFRNWNWVYNTFLIWFSFSKTLSPRRGHIWFLQRCDNLRHRGRWKRVDSSPPVPSIFLEFHTYFSQK